MQRLAVLSNGASRGNHRGRWARWRTVGPSVAHVVTSDVGDLAGGLATLLRAKPAALAIDGGDGTLQTFLSFCLQHDLLEQLPPLAVLPGGTTNMSAGDVSRSTRFGQALRAFLRLRTLPMGHWPLATRPVVAIGAADGSQHAGLFFGLGHLVTGVVSWQASLRQAALAGSLGVAVAVARTAHGIARRRPPFDAVSEVRFSLDGSRERPVATTALMVTALDRLVLRMRPHWGPGAGPLACTWLEASAPNLLRTLPIALWGGGERLGSAAGYGSCRGNAVDLSFAGPWLLDGEVVHAPAPLTLSATPKLRFVVLGAVPT